MSKDKTALSFLGETFEVDVTPSWSNCGEYCRAVTVGFIFRIISQTESIAIDGPSHVETESVVEGLVDD